MQLIVIYGHLRCYVRSVEGVAIYLDLDLRGKCTTSYIGNICRLLHALVDVILVVFLCRDWVGVCRFIIPSISRPFGTIVSGMLPSGRLTRVGF